MRPVGIILKIIWIISLRRISEKCKLLTHFCFHPASMRKLQDQNEAFQSNRAKMAEGMALALEKKDQEWMEKLASLEQVKMLCDILDKVALISLL